MTAQNLPNEDLPTTETETDPLGPINIPVRSAFGARALALVGTVGLSAVAAITVVDGGSTWPTINC
jgi:hypothetical protein